MKNIDVIINKLKDLIEPIVVEKGLKLYHIEYVNEEGNNFLRIYIDNENGISLDDCEKVSRPISDLLDIKDPISDSYYLEVSSPGINRILYTDVHFNTYLGHIVTVKLISLYNGKKIMTGKLLSFNENELKIFEEDRDIIIPRNIIKTVNLGIDEFEEDNKKWTKSLLKH